MVQTIHTVDTSLDIPNIQEELAQGRPQKILKFALKKFDNIAIAFSGAEDVILIDMAVKIRPDVNVFCLDTGRLHPETYGFIDQVRNHYNLNIELLFPDPEQVEGLVREKGLFSFYKDGHKECCSIRKVRPLRRKLSTLDAWVTGQRQDQSQTRSNLPVIQHDGAFSTEMHTLVKFNPLSNWTSDQVWQYIRAYEVPFNPLHSQGFVSIGCAPCTRSILPHQHERQGRWWWENPDDKECGLHATNTAQK
ncbi:phosphoadenylyl-sulfate reductase [Acaryochloris marina]|uniref:phosphoadenylyl-sulfate reductase n=1 Tax=Acaryochloris marina TaxID=155978 RepID=UPI0021C3D611|nr:phosphoadenylyl-sulfate reductase [Acaryochloris marina]BDM83381.1 phosphoadenosine phosphosulfate reductase [Acaryochloris marina MBIC10699]